MYIVYKERLTLDYQALQIDYFFTINKKIYIIGQKVGIAFRALPIPNPNILDPTT